MAYNFEPIAPAARPSRAVGIPALIDQLPVRLVGVEALACGTDAIPSVMERNSNATSSNCFMIGYFQLVSGSKVYRDLPFLRFTTASSNLGDV